MSTDCNRYRDPHQRGDDGYGHAVTGAIRDAARVTGAGFEYLLNHRQIESNLNPNAKAKTSSATGLFQFIDQTWLGTMKQAGRRGSARYADAISRSASALRVADPR